MKTTQRYGLGMALDQLTQVFSRVTVEGNLHVKCFIGANESPSVEIKPDAAGMVRVTVRDLVVVDDTTDFLGAIVSCQQALLDLAKGAS